jgi:hypothetical protein
LISNIGLKVKNGGAMAIILSDKKIADLVQEKKPLPEGYRAKIQMRVKSGHKERELDVKGEHGNEFRLIIRQSLSNPLDFSIILAYRQPKSNLLFRLRRYNGRSHEHTNIIEAETFYDFHIHQATGRYQEFGSREDAFAERTDRFAGLQQAVSCLLKDCAFGIPNGPQGRLFEEV